MQLIVITLHTRSDSEWLFNTVYPLVENVKKLWTVSPRLTWSRVTGHRSLQGIDCSGCIKVF